MTRVVSFLLLAIVLAVAPNYAVIAKPNDDILVAAKSGDRAGVLKALARGASVNAREKPLQQTPLALSLSPFEGADRRFRKIVSKPSF